MRINEANLGLANKIKGKASSKTESNAIDEISFIGGIEDAFRIVKDTIENSITYKEIKTRPSKRTNTNHWSQVKEVTYKVNLMMREYKDQSGNLFKPEMVFVITDAPSFSWSNGKYLTIPYDPDEEYKVGLIVFMNWKICTDPSNSDSFFDRKVEVIPPKHFKGEDLSTITLIVENLSKLAEALDNNPGLYPVSWSKKEYEALTRGIQTASFSLPASSTATTAAGANVLNIDTIKKWLETNEMITYDNDDIDLINTVWRILPYPRDCQIVFCGDITMDNVSNLYQYVSNFDALTNKEIQQVVRIYQQNKGKVLCVSAYSPSFHFFTEELEIINKSLQRFNLNCRTYHMPCMTLNELLRDHEDIANIHIMRGSANYKRLEDAIISYFRKNRRINVVKKIAAKILQEANGQVNESFIGQKDKAEVSITNSQGQDTIEPGKHSENVYLPDCPFLLGKEQVDWFEYFQQEKEKHTIKDVDDFIASAKKGTKLIKESSLGLSKKVRSQATQKDAIDLMLNLDGCQDIEDVLRRVMDLVNPSVTYSGLKVTVRNKKEYWDKTKTKKISMSWKGYTDMSGNVFSPEMVVILTESDMLTWSQGVTDYFNYDGAEIPVGLSIYANFRICTNPEGKEKLGFNDRRIRLSGPKSVEDSDLQDIINLVKNTSKLAEALDNDYDLYPLTYTKKGYERLVNGILSPAYEVPVKIEQDSSLIVTREEVDKWIRSLIKDNKFNVSYLARTITSGTCASPEYIIREIQGMTQDGSKSQKIEAIVSVVHSFLRANRNTNSIKELVRALKKDVTAVKPLEESYLGLAKKVSSTHEDDEVKMTEEIGVFSDTDSTIMKIKIDLIDRAPSDWFLYNSFRGNQGDFLQFISKSFDGILSSRPVGVITFDFGLTDDAVEIESGGENLIYPLGEPDTNRSTYDECMSEMFNATETFTEEDDGFLEYILDALKKDEVIPLTDIVKENIKRNIKNKS